MLNYWCIDNDNISLANALIDDKNLVLKSAVDIILFLLFISIIILISLFIIAVFKLIKDGFKTSFLFNIVYTNVWL